jgi:hypothetical protein
LLLAGLLPCVVLLAVFLASRNGALRQRTAPAQVAPSADDYAAWARTHAAEVAAYSAFLRRQGVDAIVPMPELLRLGRRWRSCGGTAFVVPPRDRWPAIVPTLRLFDALRKDGLLDGARVASAYRPAAYNRCEGGSDGSRHRGNQALDLDLGPGSPDRVARLCAHWRRLGPSRGWGLGFYAPTKIHLDAAGFRTWGSDHRRGTSLCHAR